MKMNEKYSNLILSLMTILVFVTQTHGKSYFGIGNRYTDDKLLLRDERENLHTGLLEAPVIAFEYAVKDPITYIEIMSEENVLANVNFSYYDAFINGTVEATSSTMTSDGKNQPFKIFISIYGYTDQTQELFTSKVLRAQQYAGPLKPHVESGEIDHMPEIIDVTGNIEQESIENEEFNKFADNLSEEEHEEYVEHEEDDEDDDEDDSTFESMDKIIIVGTRQKGDVLLYESYQTSSDATKERTKHSVVFYFIDSAFITYIEFTIIDYHNNKTDQEAKNSYVIEYSHFTPNTLKAVIRDFKTTTLFAKVSVYGYWKDDLPESYVSYVPEKVLNESDNSMTTLSPVMHLRAQINNLQRNADENKNSITTISPQLDLEAQSAGLLGSLSTIIKNLTLQTQNDFDASNTKMEHNGSSDIYTTKTLLISLICILGMLFQSR